jgi:hypothetical protein
MKRPFSDPEKDSGSQSELHIAMAGCRMLAPEPITRGVAVEETVR